jgi:hypothetical protein
MINIKELLGLTYYISELDQFLIEYDKSHPKLSSSQRKEIAKYSRVYALRDHPSEPSVKEIFWENF